MIVRSAPSALVAAPEGYRYCQYSGMPQEVIPSLYSWWDASRLDTVIFGSSGRIERWKDRSGRGNDLTQSTVNKQPYGLGAIVEHAAISEAPPSYGYNLAPSSSARRGVVFGKNKIEDPDITMSFPKTSEIRSLWACLYISNVYSSTWGPTLMGDDTEYAFHPQQNHGKNLGPYFWVDGGFSSASVRFGLALCNGIRSTMVSAKFQVGKNIVCWSSSGDGVTGSRISRDRGWQASISGIVFEYLVSTSVFSYDVHTKMSRYLGAKWGMAGTQI